MGAGEAKTKVLEEIASVRILVFFMKAESSDLVSSQRFLTPITFGECVAAYEFRRNTNRQTIARTRWTDT